MASTQVFHSFARPDRRTLTFTLSPTKYPYANTLRRGIQTEVSILGFRSDMTETGTTTDVKVIKNSTPMSNEMLADRIGLLPIVMPKYLKGGWDPKKILFKLHVKNETDEVRIVTASDFECLEKEDGAEPKRIPNTEFFRPNPVTGDTCMIAILKPLVDKQEPEEIHIEAYASLGIGKEHTRFNPTSQCSYGYTRDEDPARVAELWTSWLRDQKKVDPAELEKDAGRKQKLENEFRSLEIYRCYKVDADGEPFSFDFTVESVGTLDTYSIIRRSLSALSNLANKYSNIDKGDLPENIEIRPVDARMKGFDFWITNEDHTLGNMIQTWLDDHNMGKSVKDGGITYIGYKIPHPLRNEMVLRIGVDDGKEATARMAFASAATGLANMFAEWDTQFVKATVERMDELADPTTPRPLRGAEAETVWQAHERIKSVGVKGSAKKK